MARTTGSSKAPLGSQEGVPVVQAAVSITRAGDGLSDALKLAPEALHYGDRVFFILEGEVTSVTFVPVSPSANALERKHKIVTQNITRVEGTQVQEFLDAEEARLEKLRDEVAGREPLPGVKGQAPRKTRGKKAADALSAEPEPDDEQGEDAE